MVRKPKWISGQVLKRIGPVTYEVTARMQRVQHHVDQIMRTGDNLMGVEQPPIEKLREHNEPLEFPEIQNHDIQPEPIFSV